MQKIDAPIAAHNIAMISSQQYLKERVLSNLSLDDPTFYQDVKTAAKIYAHAYDVAFEYITSENENLNLELEE